MDSPRYESFPSQSWNSWHQIEDIDYEEVTTSNLHSRQITFDADSILRLAVVQRGNVEDKRAFDSEP